MFYEMKIRGYVRVPPDLFKEDTTKSVLETLKENYKDFIGRDTGFVVGVLNVEKIGEGIIIPGDGAAYYETLFTILTYKPELQEVTLGRINDITDFGAFIEIGAVDGMIHVSQTMDDFVSFSKAGVLTGKESKKTIKKGDKCLARVIAISFKDMGNPKIGLTMRQAALGKLEDLKKNKEIKIKVPKEKKKKWRRKLVNEINYL